MKLKRYLAVILTLCMMASLVQFPVSAQQQFTFDTDLSLSVYVEPNFSYAEQSTSTDDEGYTVYEVSLPSNPTFAPSEYYANELNDYQKAMYRAFMDAYSSIDADDMTLKQKIRVTYTVEIEADITTNEEYNTVIKDAFYADWANFQDGALYGAIQYDHTELFWIQGVRYSARVAEHKYENGVVIFDVVAEIMSDASDLYSSDAALVSAAKSMNSVVDSIIANAPTMSEYDTLVYFNKWLKQNNTYNHPHLENDNYPLAHSCISAFLSNNVEAVGPVCQGYAYAFKYLCDKIGIDNVVITGMLYQTYGDSGLHAWNAVELDGKWYGVDVTGNDSLGNDAYGFLVGSKTTNYDSNYSTFAKSHVNDTNHVYPTLSETAYEYELVLPTLEDFDYTIQNGEATITKYKGFATEAKIPATIAGYPVTVIGSSAFSKSTITSVVIPDGVKKIDNYAFEYCKSLASVEIPGSVETIGQYAFNGSEQLKTVVLNEGVLYIGLYAFANCDTLESINLPNGLIELDRLVFTSCKSLTSITIPGTTESLGTSIFSHCTGLKSVIFEDGITTIPSMFYNCTSLTDVAIPGSVTTIEAGTFRFCESLTNVHYGGTKVQKDAMFIDKNNEYLTEAIWLFALCEENGHTYDDDKDDTCNVCEEKRVIVVVIPGDVNGDGNVNNKDLGVLRRFLNDWDVEIDELAADVNDDGYVNNKDLGILRRYLNDWDVELK